jgi:hypothetical protein
LTYDKTKLPKDVLDLLRTPWETFQDAPRIDGFSPSEGPPGTHIKILGQNLLGSRFLMGHALARVIESHRGGVTVEAPTIGGSHPIEAMNVFGSAVSSSLFHIVLKPNRFTFRGDALCFGGPGHSLTPSGKDQPVLALICLASDQSIPFGSTTPSLVAEMESKLRASDHSVNTFWEEASYGETSFKFDVHKSIISLPDKLAAYFQEAKPKQITASGAAYPITWVGGEDLSLSGDANFAVTIVFEAGSQDLSQVVKKINDSVKADSADPSNPPIEAEVANGQLRLKTGRAAADAKLEVTGGFARASVGLTAGKMTIVEGLDHVSESWKFIGDALTSYTAGWSDTDINDLLQNQYSGIIFALASNEKINLLRAEGHVSLPVNFGNNQQWKGSWVSITTGYPWHVYAHEIGHALFLPDLYDGLQAGVEPGFWDIMCCSWHDVHPSAWMKHWRSRGPGYTGKPWMKDDDYGGDDVEEITAPPANVTRTWSVLLAPVERPLPKTNPFASSHPNCPLRLAIRIKLSDDLSFYVENRQKPFSSSVFGTSKHDSEIPAEGVIITDAINRDTSQLFRVFVVMATPYSDPLDTPEETWTYYVNPTNRIQVKVKEALGADPTVYRVDVTWGDIPPATGTSYDFRIEDWKPPPWESPDIWVDTKVDNEWDEYSHSDPKKNPNVAGHPVLNGDRLRVKWESRLYARVWNDGNVEKKNVQVKFQVVLPVAMGPSPGADIDTVSVDLPPGGSAITPKVTWAPQFDNEEHICVRAFVIPDPGEKDYTNNVAQENFADWYIEKSSPYQPIIFPFQVTNPLPRRALIMMQARGLIPGFNLTVEPFRFWLKPTETVKGQAILEVEDGVMLEDAMIDEKVEPPVVSLEACVQRGCTFVPFGGVTGIAHTVRKSTLKMDSDLSGHGVVVGGRAFTDDGPIVGAKVCARLLKIDGFTELAMARAVTNQNGEYSMKLMLPRSKAFERWCLIEAVLSPTLGTGPADVGPIKLRLK